MTELTWSEVERGSAALAVWVHEYGLPLNPEDAEELVRAILYWARSSAESEEITAETKVRLDDHRRASPTAGMS
jgi:hypothetical protein